MAEKFSEILRNPHFSQFTALLSVPYRSLKWRESHPEFPFWTLLESCNKRMNEVAFASKNLRTEFIAAFTELITKLVEVDSYLFYRTEDISWFEEAMSGERALVTMSMLFALASSAPSYFTPVQAAEVTGEAESTWRNRCAEGEVIGALKAGKQWLIPVTTLRAYGHTVEARGQSIEEAEE